MKAKFIFIGIACAVVSSIVQLWVRYYFYRNNIDEFNILGSLPSFLATFGFISFLIGINKKSSNDIKMISGVTAASLFREFNSWGSNQAGNGNTFDWGDVVASLVGGLAGYLLYKYEKRTATIV